MVFLSIAWGIYGIGDTVTFGRIGKRMVIHFIGVAFLIGTICIPLAIPFFSLNLIWEGSGTTQLSNLLQMILGFIPTDIVTPFQDGNSLQIILLGVAVGVSLLILGHQTNVVAQTIEQINYVVQFLLDMLCDFVATGMNMFCLQLDLTIQSKRMNLLDTTILRKEI